MPEDLAIPGPYKNLPMLVQRDFVLYESNIINEYIDERMPHPNLMPVDPAMRARARLLLNGFEQEPFCHIACRWQVTGVRLTRRSMHFFCPESSRWDGSREQFEAPLLRQGHFSGKYNKGFIAIHVSLPIADY